MPAKSKAQQRLFGMVRSAQKGHKPASKKVAKLARKVKRSAVKEFASTKHKGLPKHKTKHHHKKKRSRVRAVST